MIKYKEFVMENTKIFIGLGGSAILVFAIVFPTVSAIPLVYSKNQESSNQSRDLNDRLNKINTLVSSQQAIKSSVVLADKALPSNDDIPDLMNQIQAIATSSGVSLKSLQFGGITKAAEGDFKNISIQAVMDGSFTNMLNMLTNIEVTSRIISVHSVSFDSQKGDSLTASLGLTAYFSDTTTKPNGKSSLDFSSPAITSTLDYIKKLKPYSAQKTDINVGKSNPFQ